MILFFVYAEVISAILPTRGFFSEESITGSSSSESISESHFMYVTDYSGLLSDCGATTAYLYDI